MKPPRCLTTICALLFAQASPAGAAAVLNPGSKTAISLPVQVFLYSFEAAPELDASADETAMRNMFAKVNEIWKRAGIHWDVQSVRTLRVSRDSFPALPDSLTHPEFKQRLLDIKAPEVPSGTWKVAILGEFAVKAGGLYTAPNQTVYFPLVTRGGPTSPVVLAHELGHSLGLEHETDTDNLMNPAAGARQGPTSDATKLTAAQIASARDQAHAGPATRGGHYDTAPSVAGDGGGGGGAPDPAARRQRMLDRIRSFDNDGDGIVLIEDVPEPGRPFFQSLDTDADNRLQPSEIQ